MSAYVTVELDLRRYQLLAVRTRKGLVFGTIRAVHIGLEHGAAHARQNHVHKRRTGLLTSPEMLRGELQVANDDGAWGYLLNETAWARFVEDGTAAHPILPLNYHWGSRRAQRPTSRVTGERINNPTMGAGRGKFLRFMVGGRVVFARSVQHPGTQPMPFMAPASVVAGERIVDETERVTFRLASELWDR